MHSKSILGLQLTIDRQAAVINDLIKENVEIKKQLEETLSKKVIKDNQGLIDFEKYETEMAIDTIKSFADQKSITQQVQDYGSSSRLWKSLIMKLMNQ